MIFGALFFASLTFFKFFVNFCILVEINAIFYIKRSKMHKKAGIKGLCPFIPALYSYIKASAFSLYQRRIILIIVARKINSP